MVEAEGGRPADDTICEHIDQSCQIAGSARNGGIGTEQTPLELDSIADLWVLGGLIVVRGYSQADIDGTFYATFVEICYAHCRREPSGASFVTTHP